MRYTLLSAIRTNNRFGGVSAKGGYATIGFSLECDIDFVYSLRKSDGSDGEIDTLQL